MKRNFKYFGIVWSVLFVLFNAIVFIIPNEIMGMTRFDKPTFWIAYFFVLISFLGNLAVTFKFVNSKNAEKMFLNIPLLYIGFGSLAISAVIGIIFMTIPVIPSWIGAIVCILALAVYILACTKAIAASDMVSEVGEKVKINTAFMRTITVDASNLMMRAKSEDAKKATKQVYEALRYSDTVSSPALADEDDRIKSMFSLFRESVIADDDEKISLAKDELLILIKERNNKCKLLK